MRYLLALLLPLTAFGQFGGFRTDQPFLAASGATALTPGAGLEFWWVAEDVVGPTFTNWTDRIQSRTLGATNGASISVANNSLVFSRSASQNIITNGTADSISVYQTNVAFSFIVDLNPNVNGNGNEGEPLARELSGVVPRDLYIDRPGAGSQVALVNSQSGTRWNLVSDLRPGLNQTMDICIANTNAGSDSYENVYVNGTLKGATLTSANRLCSFSAASIIYGANYVGLNANLKEIVIQTNIDIGTLASALHNYRISKYPYNPSNSMVCYLDAGQGVLDPYGAAATNGAKVATWTNLVSAAYPFTQATAANQGYYLTNGPNDRPFIRFPPTNSTSASGMFNNNASLDRYQVTVAFCVLRLNPQTGFSTIFDSNDINQRNSFGYVSDSNLFEMYAGTPMDGPATIQTNTWYILTARFAFDNSYMRTNGVLYKSGDAGSMSTFDGFVLNRYSGAGAYAGKNNDYAEIRVYSADLSSNEVYTVESELSQKYGITIP